MSVAGFAESGSAVVTQPDDALRADGFAFGEAVAHDELNWLLRDLYRRAAASSLWTSSARAVETGAPAVIELASLGSVGSDAGVDSPFTPADSGEGAILCADAARVYVRSDGGQVKALDAETHAVLWTGSKIGLDDIQRLACGFGYVYAGGADADYAIVAFDAETGNVTATLASDGENTAALACGNGFVVRASLTEVKVYDAATLTLVGTYDHGGMVFGLAVKQDLIALVGADSSLVTARLLAFDGSALSVVWSVEGGGSPDARSAVGFVGDVVAVYTSDSDEIRLYPVARYATAPSALTAYASGLNVASGSSGVHFCDWGVYYVRNNSARKPMLLDAKLEPVSLAAVGGFDGVAFGGNYIHAIGDSGSTRISATGQVTRCAVVGGLLGGVR